MLRSLLTAVLAVALAYCAWHAMQLFSPPAPFAQLYTQATAAQNAEITWQLILTVLVGPLVLAPLLLVSWPSLTVTRARTCFVLGAVLICAGIFGLGVWASLPYGFGSSYQHASRAQRLHLALALGAGGAFLAAGVLFVAAGVLLRWLMRATRREAQRQSTVVS